MMIVMMTMMTVMTIVSQEYEEDTMMIRIMIIVMLVMVKVTIMIPIVMTLVGIVTDVSDEHCWKAPVPDDNDVNDSN